MEKKRFVFATVFAVLAAVGMIALMACEIPSGSDNPITAGSQGGGDATVTFTLLDGSYPLTVAGNAGNVLKSL